MKQARQERTKWPPVERSNQSGILKEIIPPMVTYTRLFHWLLLEYMCFMVLVICSTNLIYTYISLGILHSALFISLFYPWTKIIHPLALLIAISSLIQGGIIGFLGGIPAIFIYLIFTTNYFYTAIYFLLSFSHLIIQNIRYPHINNSESFMQNYNSLGCFGVLTLILFTYKYMESSQFEELFKSYQILTTENSQKDVYFAGVVHELRNPLSS